ncbi:MFS transporter [Chloroflexota bacterium]
MNYQEKLPDPGRHKLFYGWWVLGACFLITFYMGGVVFFGFTAVLEPIATEFGWSYAQISLAASLRGIEIGLLAPLTGLLVDRWGPKRLIFGGAVLTGFGLILLSRINSLATFYGAFALVAIGMSGLSSTVMLAAIVNWFHRRASITTGLIVSGFALGGALIPLVTALIDKYQWHTAILILGITAWIITLPLSLLVRHKPEQYGYLPDGDTGTQAISDSTIIQGNTAGNTDGQVALRGFSGASRRHQSFTCWR